jgi:hypothetical protein
MVSSRGARWRSGLAFSSSSGLPCVVVTRPYHGARDSHSDAISLWRQGNRPMLYSYSGLFPAIQAGSFAIARW